MILMGHHTAGSHSIILSHPHTLKAIPYVLNQGFAAMKSPKSHPFFPFSHNLPEFFRNYPKSVHFATTVVISIRLLQLIKVFKKNVVCPI